MKIGFFDSGLGGLLILKAVTKQLPQYDYEFYGDTANLPFGNKPEEEIFRLTKIGVEHLFAKDCLLVIIACNTASAETLRRLQDTILQGEYATRRILGVIIPTVEVLADKALTPVMLFATKRTVASGKYQRELTKLNAELSLLSKALPEIVPLIESGNIAQAFANISAETKTARDAGARAVILGCTHYSLLKEPVREIMGDSESVFSQDEIIPNKLQQYLYRHPELEGQLTRQATRNIYLTNDRQNYLDMVRDFIGT